MRARGILVLAGFAFAAAVSAQTKVSGELRCGKPDPYQKVDTGDRPNHAVTLSKSHCTWTKPTEMAGSPTKDGDSVATGEIDGDKSWEKGFHTGTVASGDKFYVRYTGEGMSKDGKMVGAKGTYTFAGGTGKLKGLKGKGTYSGKPDANGDVIFHIEGAYTLPK